MNVQDLNVLRVMVPLCNAVKEALKAAQRLEEQATLVARATDGDLPAAAYALQEVAEFTGYSATSERCAEIAIHRYWDANYLGAVDALGGD